MSVSSNVSHHIFKSVQLVASQNCQSPERSTCLGKNSWNNRASSVLPLSKMRPAATKVCCWLALRASVLRRAVSSGSTAQERRARLSAGAVFWDFRCIEPICWSSALHRGAMQFRKQRPIPTSTPPRKSVAQFKTGASNGFNISAPSNQGQCRGRNGDHSPPPAQIRTCGATAYGSYLG